MGKSLTGLALLLAGALTWAYLLTHPFGDAPPAGLVRVWKVEPRAISGITLRQEGLRVELEPRWEEDGEPFVWVRVEQDRAAERRKARPHRPRGGEQQGAEEERAPDEPLVSTKSFKGNAKAMKAVRELADLFAPRAVGRLDSLEAKEFGLDAPAGTLRVELRGEKQPLELQLGATTYGKHMRYAATGGEGRVYLFRQSVFNRFLRAHANLIERRLFPFSPERAARIRVIQSGQERDCWRRGNAAPDEPEWGESPDAAEGSPAFQAFMGELRRLRVVEYLAEPGDEAAAGEMAALEVRVFREATGGEAAWLRLFPEGDKGVIARASHSRTRVRVSQRMGGRVLTAAARLMENQEQEGAAAKEGG